MIFTIAPGIMVSGHGSCTVKAPSKNEDSAVYKMTGEGEYSQDEALMGSVCHTVVNTISRPQVWKH